MITVGYYFAPQDRRKIGEKPVHEYVLEYFKDIFQEELCDVEEETGRTLKFCILGAEQDEVEEIAEKLWDIVDLSDASFYTVIAEKKDADEEEGFDEEEERLKLGLINTDEADKAVDQLVGVEDFKALCRDIASVALSEQAKVQRDFFENCAVLVSISGGDGFSHCMFVLRKVLEAYGVRKFPDLAKPVLEIKKNETNEDMLAALNGAYEGEMVCFDLTFKIQNGDTEAFRDLILQMQRSRRMKQFLVFKIPFSEGEERRKIEKVLRSVFPLIVINVPPFTTEQYSEFVGRTLARMGYEMEDAARDAVSELIVQKRNQKHFYGFMTAENLASEIVAEKMRAEIRRKEEMSLVIKKEDLLPMVKRYDAEHGGLDALDEMIGIEAVRERIEEVLVQLEISAKLPPEERPCMHMLFSGNPGTGKTTVARILGKILKERNVLSKGLFFERTGREFVGRYIGETAPITNAICRDAYGSVLFIDEAYTLYRHEDERDFGKEALDTLLTQMENHRQDLIVIFSGYSDKMKDMLEANPGLKSRIPHEVKFPNFTRDDLFKIYMQMAGRTYRVAEDLEKTAKEFFHSMAKEILDEKSFSNARFVRNLYERTVSKAALRVQAMSGGRTLDASSIELTGEDFKKASTAEEFQELLQKKNRMGFV